MDKGKQDFRGSIPLLIVEIFVLAIAVGVMYVVVTMTSEVNHKEIDEENIVINEEIVKKKTTEVKQTEKEKEEVKKRDTATLHFSAWMPETENWGEAREATPL